MTKLMDDPRLLGPTVSEARLISVLDTAVDGIIVIDDDGRIMLFNHACERLFGLTMQEAVGQNVRIIMPPDYAGQHDTYLDNYHRTGDRKIIGIGREVRGRHKDGTVFPLEISVGETRTPDGRQFIGILRDLRPRKEAERRLNQLQADLLHMARISAIDEMGAALAHEINQPLTAIMLYLQAVTRAAARGGAGAIDEATLAILEKARKEAERAGAIIQRMRHFAERREPARRPVALAPVVDDAVELTMMGHRGSVRVRRAHDPAVTEVLVDPVQIQQIIVNLVRNAIEAARASPEPAVAVTTSLDGGWVAVDVEDNGPGIPPEVAAHLFRAFSSTKQRGMGLGLAISKTIAQAHGGDLMVDPGGAGRGARFTLKLPVDIGERGA